MEVLAEIRRITKLMSVLPKSDLKNSNSVQVVVNRTMHRCN